MQTRWVYGVLAGILVVMVALTGCVTQQPAQQQAKLDKVIFGLPVDSIDFLPLFVANEKGYLRASGIEPEIIVLKGGGEAARALASGDVHVAALGLGHAAQLRGKDTPTQYISAFNTTVAFSLVARKGAGISSIKDLKGKVIGITGAGSLTHATTMYLVKQAGLDPAKDVTIVPTGGGGESIAALKSAKADAAMLFEPHVATVISEGIAVEVVDLAKEMKNFVPNGMTVTEKWATANPKLVEGLFNATVKALNYINTDREGTLAFTKTKFASMAPETVKVGLDHYYPTFSPDAKVSLQDAQVTQQIMKDVGIIEKVFPRDEIVHPIARKG